MGASPLATNFEEFSKRLMDDEMAQSVLMVENPLGLSSKKAAKIVDKLLTRAFNEGRGEEMIKDIVRRVHKIKSWVAEDAGHLEFIKELDRATHSPTLRLFNLAARTEGRKEMLCDETGDAYKADKEAHMTPEEKKAAKYAQMLADMPATNSMS